MAVTKDQIKAAQDELRANQVPPARVRTWWQAIRWTLRSRFTQVWKKGDEYYVGVIPHGNNEQR